MPGEVMSIRDNIVLYDVANAGGIRYRDHTALATTWYLGLLERYSSAQRELMDIALAELVAHGLAVAPDYAKPIEARRLRPQGEPLMFEIKHRKHPRFALRGFGILLPYAPPGRNVLMINLADKRGLDEDAFYENHAKGIDRFIDGYLLEGN
jgi:hypothetical protein